MGSDGSVSVDEPLVNDFLSDSDSFYVLLSFDYANVLSHFAPFLLVLDVVPLGNQIIHAFPLIREGAGELCLKHDKEVSHGWP